MQPKNKGALIYFVLPTRSAQQNKRLRTELFFLHNIEKWILFIGHRKLLANVKKLQRKEVSITLAFSAIRNAAVREKRHDEGKS